MNNLLVLSVYRPGHWGWFHVQMKFLEATTSHFQFCLISPEKPPFDVWHAKSNGPAHIQGLRKAVEVLRAHRNTLQAVLILDSDAFPVSFTWRETLDAILARTGRKFAAPIRAELYHTWPHVSFLYFRIKHLDFVASHLKSGRYTRLDGLIGGDIGTLPADQCVPLLKSNRWSPSSTLHTIYGGLAYHRAVGSRDGEATAAPWWRQLNPCDAEIAEAHTEFPDVAFINKLLGEERFI